MSVKSASKTIGSATILVLMAMVFVTQPSFALVGIGKEKLEACAVGVRHPVSGDESRAGQDTIVYEYDDLLAVPGHPTQQRGDYVTAPVGTGNYVVGENLPFLSKITKINFQFSSENYGTNSFIQLCYRGPERKPTGPTGADASLGIYGLDLNVTLQDQSQAGLPSYRQASGLISRVQVKCDLRSRGSLTGNPLDDENIIEPEPDFSWTSEPFEWNGSSKSLEVILNQRTQDVPRFCVVRLYFLETKKTPRLSNTALREVQLNVTVDKQDF